MWSVGSGGLCLKTLFWLEFWTSLDQAKGFATRFSLKHPGVYRAVVKADDVLAYANERDEQEMARTPVTPQRKSLWSFRHAVSAKK
jgi:hypothetical protein